MSQGPITETIELSHWLGDPSRDLVELGEGNVSIVADDESFFVTASGMSLGDIDTATVVRMHLAKTLAIVDLDEPADDAVAAGLLAARIGRDDDRRPSVETPLHAVCLSLPGVACVGHTHPTAVNALTCSVAFERSLAGRLFHDEILVCGAESLLLPYVESGVPLARTAREALSEFINRHGEPPRTIYLQNHGLVALGSSPPHVRAITAMAVKAARIRIGAASLGGIHPLDEEAVQRIATRPDERYRRLKLEQGQRKLPTKHADARG